MTTTSIIDQLAAAIRAKDDSIADLRSRIAEILAPIPAGAVLSDAQGEVCRIVRVCTGASQWSNRYWSVTIRGTGALTAGGELLATNLADRLWDGSNMHYRSTEPTCRYQRGEIGDTLRNEHEMVTRELAARLPAAIAAYMAQCEATTAANCATVVAQVMQA